MVRNEEIQNQWRFVQSGIQTLSSCHSLGYARGNKSIIFFNDLCKPIEIYIYARKKHPFTSYPAGKHPKIQQVCHYRHARKTRGPFFLYNTGFDFSSSNNFANSGSFAKVSISVETIISWLIQVKFLELQAPEGSVSLMWEDNYHFQDSDKQRIIDFGKGT